MTEMHTEVVEALRECSAYRAPVVILNAEASSVCHGRLTSMTENSVTLEVAGEVKPPPRISHCCVSFSFRGRSRAFFSRLLEFQQSTPPQPSHFLLEFPQELVSIEARISCRIPVARRHGLAIQVTVEEKMVLHPTPVDLSLTGILIEFSDAEDPDLPKGAKLRVSLQLGPDAVDLKAEVARRSRRQYGLFFPEVVTEHGLIPPAPLTRIVETIERSWLPARTRI